MLNKYESAHRWLIEFHRALINKPNAIDFVTGDPGFTNPLVIEAITKVLQGGTNLGELPQIPSVFIDKLISHLNKKLKTDSIEWKNFLFSQSTFGIFEGVLQYFVNKEKSSGKKTVFLSPSGSYSLYNVCAGKILQDPQRILDIPALEKIEADSLDSFCLDEKIKEKSGVLLLENPSSLGYVYSEQEIQAIKKIADKHRLQLFVDGVYSNFIYDLDYTPVQPAENVVSVQPLSKGYGNIQFSLALASIPERMKSFLQEYLGRVWRVVTDVHVAVNSLIIDSPNEIKKLIEEAIESYKQKTRLLTGSLDRHLVKFIPQSGYSMVLDVPIETQNKQQLFSLLYKQEILVDPLYGIPNSNLLRIVYGKQPIENIQKLISIINQL